MEDNKKLEYWLRYFGMPEENIENCMTQIAQGYGACRYLDGVSDGADAVNELSKEESASEELESFAKREADLFAECDSYDRGFLSKGFYWGCKQGANWQKQQMMKDAVEVEVKIDAGGYPYIPAIELYDYDKDVPFAKAGDKVKVKIVKKD